MIYRWFPWKFLVSRAARSYQILDPVLFLAKLRKFSQPSEVAEPIELLRAGILFHARGLINTKAIQQNLDWVWPFWVERQFRPGDPSFLPRAFSFSHVNLTHRNWTAVGHPQMPVFPIIDPAGLVTPHWDSWSVDFAFLDHEGAFWFPSRAKALNQYWDNAAPHELITETKAGQGGLHIGFKAGAHVGKHHFWLRLAYFVKSPKPGRFMISLRPYNPEGVQFIEELAYDPSRALLRVNDQHHVVLDTPPRAVYFSNFKDGDVLHHVHERDTRHRLDSVSCEAGMATAAAVYDIPANQDSAFEVFVPLTRIGEKARVRIASRGPAPTRLFSGNDRYDDLFEQALKTLNLLSAGNTIVPGPYTYKRFWFRDACLMLHSLLLVDRAERVKAIIDTFAAKQQKDGYFLSQEGEWDANGQVLWLLGRYQEIANDFDPAWLPALIKGADWIVRKRHERRHPGELERGLLPAGFSAEHLGTNDYYYWDDFWSLAGLRQAVRLLKIYGDQSKSTVYRQQADQFEKDIRQSIAAIPEKYAKGALPASPYRRMDAGAVGSLVADYPLQLYPAGEARIRNTVEFLMANCFFQGAFFQDIIHSGINVYLSLAIAQSLLRVSDARFQGVLKAVADLASPTGQWPEAIHPHTGGGCMGDGQHGWAAAEWIAMMRNLFVREEKKRQLVIGGGLAPQLEESGPPLFMGPSLTRHGRLSLRIERDGPAPRVKLDAKWHDPPDVIRIAVPGYQAKTAPPETTEFILEKRDA